MIQYIISYTWMTGQQIIHYWLRSMMEMIVYQNVLNCHSCWIMAGQLRCSQRLWLPAVNEETQQVGTNDKYDANTDTDNDTNIHGETEIMVTMKEFMKTHTPLMITVLILLRDWMFWYQQLQHVDILVNVLLFMMMTALLLEVFLQHLLLASEKVLDWQLVQLVFIQTICSTSIIFDSDNCLYWLVALHVLIHRHVTITIKIGFAFVNNIGCHWDVFVVKMKKLRNDFQMILWITQKNCL